MSLSDAAALRLKAIVEADPGALVRLLQLFQIRNVIPRQVRARRIGCQYIEAEIDLDTTELPIDVLRLIAAKARALPITLVAVALDSDEADADQFRSTVDDLWWTNQ